MLRIHFADHCAYCEANLRAHGAKSNYDHLVSGGTNHISNRVLSCETCNQEEKRERDWLEFLKEKCKQGEFERRRDLILSWIQNGATMPQETAIPASTINYEIEMVITANDVALERIRALR